VPVRLSSEGTLKTRLGVRRGDDRAMRSGARREVEQGPTAFDLNPPTLILGGWNLVRF
jgi:hypothetical protein